MQGLTPRTVRNPGNRNRARGRVSWSDRKKNEAGPGKKRVSVVSRRRFGRKKFGRLPSGLKAPALLHV